MKIRKSASKLQVSPHSLYYWRSTGLLSSIPAGSKRGELSFTDIIRARFICLCRKEGISLQALRQAVANNSDWQTKLRLYAYGQQNQILVQKEEDKLFLPTTRQLLLNFEKEPKTQPISFHECLEKRKESKVEQVSATIQKLEENYEAALEKENRKEGEKILKKIVKLDPEHLSAWMEIGNFYFHEGKISKAREAYERSIELAPACTEALYNLANLHFKAKRYGVSIRYFQKCLEADPEFIEAHYNFALVLYHLGRYQKSAELLEDYLSKDSESFWAEQAHRLLEEIEVQVAHPSSQDSHELRLF